MTIKQLLTQHYKSNLPQQEIDDLLALALHKKVEYLYKHPEKKLALSTIRAFKKLLNLRLQNWPMAYLRGYQEFYGLKFLVNKNTLIPRPDSELIIDASLKFLKNRKEAKVLDVGTGSGCLIISLAKKFNTANYFASDISKQALKIARTNARKNNVHINFIYSDLLNNIPEQKFDLIIANLPYLTPQQMKEPSIKKEPRPALLAGSDGLDYYQKLLSQISKFLNKEFLVLLEIDPEQTKKIQDIIKKYLPKSKIKIIPDLARQNRLIKITQK
jgi:release factor glutamine methyltransferase